MLNDFSDPNDRLRVSVAHLLDLVNDRIGAVRSLFQVSFEGSNSVHYIAAVGPDQVVCDCLMNSNVGIPCRHFFSLLRHSNGQIGFHLNMYNGRYAAVISSRPAVR